MFTARYKLNVYIKIVKNVGNIVRPYSGGSQACEPLSGLSADIPRIK